MNKNINGHNLIFQQQLNTNSEHKSMEIWICLNCDHEFYSFDYIYSKWNGVHSCDDLIIKDIIE